MTQAQAQPERFEEIKWESSYVRFKLLEQIFRNAAGEHLSGLLVDFADDPEALEEEQFWFQFAFRYQEHLSRDTIAEWLWCRVVRVEIDEENRASLIGILEQEPEKYDKADKGDEIAITLPHLGLGNMFFRIGGVLIEDWAIESAEEAWVEFMKTGEDEVDFWRLGLFGLLQQYHPRGLNVIHDKTGYTAEEIQQGALMANGKLDPHDLKGQWSRVPIADYKAAMRRKHEREKW